MIGKFTVCRIEPLVPWMVAVNVPSAALVAASSLNPALAAGDVPDCAVSDAAVHDVTPDGRPTIANSTVPEKPFSDTTLMLFASKKQLTVPAVRVVTGS